MRVAPLEKLLLALATAASLLVALAAPASANTRSADAEGTITIKTDPAQVIEVPAEEPHPCTPEVDPTATADGTATSGTMAITLPPKFIIAKPGSTPVVEDQIDLTIVFQDLTYTGTSPAYDITGQVALLIDISNLDEECNKLDVKCSFGLVFDVEATFDGGPLPTIDPGDTATLIATTEGNTPLTYLGGDDCEEYIAINGVDVNMALDLAFT